MPKKKVVIQNPLDDDADTQPCSSFDQGSNSESDNTEDGEGDGDYVQALVNKYAGASSIKDRTNKKDDKHEKADGDEPASSSKGRTPKRKVCSEKQKAHLEKTREKALQVRRELAAKRKQEKEAEKRRIEEEKILREAERIREQERRIEARLLKERELSKAADRPSRSSTKPSRVRKKTPMPRPAKRRIIVEDPSDDDDDESDSSQERYVRRKISKDRRDIPRDVRREPVVRPSTIRRSIFDDIV